MSEKPVMTKTQGRIIIVLLMAAIFLLMLLVYNVFNGLAALHYKIDKTQAMVKESIATPQAPPAKAPSP